MRLRAIEPSDADLLYRAENEHFVFIRSDNPAPYSRKMLSGYAAAYKADPFTAGELRLVAVCDDGAPAGIVDLYNISLMDRHAYVAIMLLPEFRGKGLSAKILQLLIRYAARALGLSSLLALVHTDNLPSLSLFRRCGFSQAGVLNKWSFSDGKLKDVVIFQLMTDSVRYNDTTL